MYIVKTLSFFLESSHSSHVIFKPLPLTSHMLALCFGISPESVKKTFDDECPDGEVSFCATIEN